MEEAGPGGLGLHARHEVEAKQQRAARAVGAARDGRCARGVAVAGHAGLLGGAGQFQLERAPAGRQHAGSEDLAGEIDRRILLPELARK